MQYAEVRGREMSIREFCHKPEDFRSNPGKIYCLECRVVVTAKAINTLAVPAHFSHPPSPQGLSDLDDCSRAARSRRLRWFGEEDRDKQRGLRVRRAFFEEGAIKAAYAFCRKCVGNGNLPLIKFEEMIRRADRLDIWSYAGIEVWCVPHILLLLADFAVDTNQACHFALVKTSKISAIWHDPKPVRIKKLFSDSGNQAEKIAGLPNPHPITKCDVANVDTSWMKSNFSKKLVESGHRRRST